MWQLTTYVLVMGASFGAIKNRKARHVIPSMYGQRTNLGCLVFVEPTDN
jgi:hypothetical protein